MAQEKWQSESLAHAGCVEEWVPGRAWDPPSSCEETLALGGGERAQARLEEGALFLHEGSSQRDKNVSGSECPVMAGQQRWWENCGRRCIKGAQPWVGTGSVMPELLPLGADFLPSSSLTQATPTEVPAGLWLPQPSGLWMLWTPCACLDSAGKRD